MIMNTAVVQTEHPDSEILHTGKVSTVKTIRADGKDHMETVYRTRVNKNHGEYTF